MAYWQPRRKRQQGIQAFAPQPARDNARGTQPIDYLAPQPKQKMYSGGMSSFSYPSGTNPPALSSPAKGWGGGGWPHPQPTATGLPGTASDTGQAGGMPSIVSTIGQTPTFQDDPYRPPKEPPKEPPPAPAPGLMLSPEYEAARRALDDELAAVLSQYGVQEQDIAKALGLTTARLATDQLLDEDTINQNLAARGIFQSGIRKTDQERLAANYGRTRQDLANQTANQYRDIAWGKSAAQMKYNKELQELLIDLAAWQASQAKGTDDTNQPPNQPPTKPPPGPTWELGSVDGLGNVTTIDDPEDDSGDVRPRDPGYHALPQAIQNQLGTDTLGYGKWEPSLTRKRKKKKKGN